MARLRQFAVRTYDEGRLQRVLDDLDEWLVHNNRPVASALAPGASKRAMDGAEAASGYPLPEEVRQVLGWHDGNLSRALDTPLLWYHALLSIDASMELRRTMSMIPGAGFRRNWWPLFVFQDEIYFVACTKERHKALPVRFYMGEVPETPAAFTSVSSLFETLLTGFTSGAVHSPDDEGITQWRLPVVRQIHQRFNPGVAFPYFVDEQAE